MMLSKYLFRPGKAARHRKDKCDFKDPENSIGNKIGYLKNGRYTVWKAIGPARDLFERLSPEIKAFLERGSNPVSETVIWSIYMIGRTTESAAPKVMFCSADASARREIRATIKDSGIMDKYPGIGLGDMPEPPDQQNPVPLAVQDVELPMDSEAGSIVLGAPSTTSVGKRLFVRNSNGHSLRPATAGPIIYWNGKSYYLTAAHPFNECSSIIARNSRPSFSSECDFDGQSDTDGDDDNSDDDDNIQEITSRGSLTPEDLRSRYQSSSNGESDTLSQDGFSSDEESGILTWTEETMDAANLPVYSPDLAGTNESLASYAQTQQSAQTSISVLSTLGLTGRLALSSETGANSSLDYALVEIAESDTQKANEVYCALEATSPRLKIANFRKIGPTDVDILTVTASEGLLSGRLSATASYMRLPNTRTFQEVYTIQLDGTVSDGDCGSAVFDKLSGDLYGHIVAGSPGTGMAYIIPATQVFEDLARRLGDGLTLVPPEELPSNIITLAPIESGTHKLSQCYTLSTSTSSSSMSRSPYLLKMQAEPAAQVPSPISPSPISDIQDHSLILKNKVLENKTLNLQHAKLDSQGQQYGPCYCRRRHCGDYGHCKDLWFCEDLWFCGDYGHCEGCEDWWSCWHCGHHRERRLWGSRGEEEEYALPDLEGHPRIREEGSRIPPSKGYGNADGDRSELERDHPGSADHDGEGNRNDDGGDGQRSREIRERPPKKTPFRRYRDFHDFSNRNRKKTNETKRLTRYEHFRKIIDELKLPDRHDRNADKMRIVRDWLYDEAKETPPKPSSTISIRFYPYFSNRGNILVQSPQTLFSLMPASAVAASKGHETIVRLLLQNGADIDQGNSQGKTVLHWGIRRYDTLVRLPFQNGPNINQSDSWGRAALHQSAGRGNERVVQLLFQNGADINQADSQGETALHKAAFLGHEMVVRLLLQNGADINQVVAVFWERDMVVRLPFENGPDINQSDSWGRAALHQSAGRGNERVVQLLPQNGADINPVDSQGETALHKAAFWGRDMVVRLLLQNGADINQVDSWGETALRKAARRGYETAVRLLLQNGADINQVDSQGETALHWAALGRHETVELTPEMEHDTM